MRRHHATLLHYVGANGIESFRQKTPANAVDIARLLLDAGAAEWLDEQERGVPLEAMIRRDARMAGVLRAGRG